MPVYVHENFHETLHQIPFMNILKYTLCKRIGSFIVFVPMEVPCLFNVNLIDGYGIDTETKSILDHTETHLVFESNPDGRAVAETKRGCQ